MTRPTASSSIFCCCLALWACGGKSASAPGAGGSMGGSASGGAATQAGGGSANTQKGGDAGAQASGGASSGGDALPPEFIPVPQQSVDAIKLVACAGVLPPAEATFTQLLLLVDASESMTVQATALPIYDLRTVRESLLIIYADEPPASVLVGLKSFPNQTGEPSSEPVDSGQCVNQAFDKSLPPAVPLHASQNPALSQAIERLSSVPGAYSTLRDAYHLAALELDGAPDFHPKIIALFSTGEPTLDLGCVRPTVPGAPLLEALVQDIEEASARGIETLVIGTPGSNRNFFAGDARPLLSRAARAGGTAKAGCNDAGPNYCHVDLTGTTDHATVIGQALAKIVKPRQVCEVRLPTPPTNQTIDLNAINVFADVGGVSYLVRKDTSGQCSAGWQVSGDSVVICASTCEALDRAEATGISVLFGCRGI
ncbi:MAG: hypothetical protein QM756_26100 [Polyangiaceae bacterium]